MLWRHTCMLGSPELRLKGVFGAPGSCLEGSIRHQVPPHRSEVSTHLAFTRECPSKTGWQAISRGANVLCIIQQLATRLGETPRRLCGDAGSAWSLSLVLSVLGHGLAGLIDYRTRLLDAVVDSIPYFPNQHLVAKCRHLLMLIRWSSGRDFPITLTSVQVQLVGWYTIARANDGCIPATVVLRIAFILRLRRSQPQARIIRPHLAKVDGPLRCLGPSDSKPSWSKLYTFRNLGRPTREQELPSKAYSGVQARFLVGPTLSDLPSYGIGLSMGRPAASHDVAELSSQYIEDYMRQSKKRCIIGGCSEMIAD
jgi:hypothetical protein